MKFFDICSLCLLTIAAATLRAKSRTGSPVEQVVTLLKDLRSQIETDSKVEQKMYDKYACWCEKTAARKAKNIETGLDGMRALSQEILTLKGKVATLESEITGLADDMAETQAAMDEATALREKQNGAFMAESAEMKDALGALQSAIKVLVDATLPGKGSFLQEQTRARSRMAVRAVVDALPSRVNFPIDRVSMLSTFVDAASGYAPQSAAIQGILIDMYTTFSADLESSTQLEAERNTEFEKLMATKKMTMDELATSKAKKESELAEAEEDLAEASKTYDDTFGQKEADVKFFDETKKACTLKWEEWSLRQELRNEELLGISKAIEILSADDARDTFQVSIKAGKEVGVDASIDPLSFFQLSNAADESKLMFKAYNVLKARATRSHSLRLAQLAVKVRTAKVGHFEEVIGAIDTMMNTLKSEGADDLAKKTTCLDEYQTINETLSDLSWKLEVNEAKILKLEKKIELKTQAKDAAISEIDATEDHLDAIKKIRDEQHDAFLQAKADDQKAVGLLKDAKVALEAYYKKNSIALGPIQGSIKGLSLRQAADPVFNISADQAPDATLSGKGSHKGETKDIVSLMTYLIEDAEDEVRNGISTEAAQQAAYEEEKAVAENLLSELIAKKSSLETDISKAGEDKVEENGVKSGNNDEKEVEEDYYLHIKADCDFVIGAFDKRAEARATEMAGLTQAKEYLAGSQSSFIEYPAVSKSANFAKATKRFDNSNLPRNVFLHLKH